MNKRLRRALILTLSLLLSILPLCSQAEEALPSADHLNMTTVAVTAIRYDDGSGEKELPLTIDLTVGANPAERRALALISLNTGGDPLTFMGSIEEEEIRARISGIDPLLTAALPQAEDELIRSTLLLGLEYEDLSEETLAALDEYLALLEESMLMPARVVESSDVVEAMYPADLWREDYEKYPSLMNASPAGEEEITLFGKVYTAKKYTYSMENATEEEFLAFYEAYDAHFYNSTGSLDEAYETLMNLVYEDYYASMQAEDVWKDDGSSAESGSLSEWDESEQYEYLYSIEGTIWQVDEVMGMLEEYTAVTRGPEGEYVDTYSCSEMLTGGLMRYESTASEYDPYYNAASSYTNAMTVQSDETGRILMEGMTLSGVEYPDEPDYSYATNLSWRSEMTEDRLLLSVSETASGLYETDQVMSLTADFALGQEEETGLLNRASGTLELEISLMGQQLSASIDLVALLSTLPAGTLLPVSGETLDLFEADSDALASLITELESLLLQTFGSFIPSPEAPSSVGGALLG